MAPLKITLHSFWAKHAAVERKLLPRFETDDPILADLELNPALLSAKTAVGLHQFLGRMDRFIFPPAGRDVVEVRPELLV